LLFPEPFPAPADDEELPPEPGFVLPVCEPPEPDPLPELDSPPEDEDEEEGPLADGAAPESSPLLQAVSESVAARPMAASAAVRVNFIVIPQQVARCVRSTLFVSRTELRLVPRYVFVLSRAN
jgi:hypothetical protein